MAVLAVSSPEPGVSIVGAARVHAEAGELAVAREYLRFGPESQAGMRMIGRHVEARPVVTDLSRAYQLPDANTVLNLITVGWIDRRGRG